MRSRVFNSSTKSRLKFGFTIIELIVTISIIGILAAITIVSYNGWKQSSTITQIKSDLNGAIGAMEDYRTFNDRYPSDINTLSTFAKSSGVTLSGGSVDGGKTFCIDIVNSQFPSLYYNINSTSSISGAQLGTCGPVNLIAISTSISSINLSWSVKSGATSYVLQQDTNSNFSTPTTIATQAGTSFTSNGLTVSTKYYYRVKATVAGADTGWSSSASTTTITPPTSPSAPTIAVVLSGSNVLATITPVAACTTGILQYGINSRTNDGAWAGWTAWSATLTASQTANDGVKYGYQAQARCYLDPVFSATVTSSEATYTDPISVPSTPVVAANTAGTTTTFSWGAASCPGNTARYQYRYTISPSGYDSGLVATAATSVAFTSSTEGQTYTVATQAECYSAVTASGMSTAGFGSYFRPITQYTLTIAAGTGGTVNAGGSYNTGTVQTVTATPSIYYSFSSWTGSTGCAGVASHSITMDANKSCTANFTPTAIAPPAIPVVAANTAGATTTFSWGAAYCPGNTARYQYRYTISPSGYDSGLVATAATSVAFTSSTENQTYTVATQAECYNTATASGMSAAGSGSYFRPITQYTLTIAAGTGGTVNTGGSYNTGTVQTITATPSTYYSFSSWTGSTGCSGVASHTITMDANKSCTANFVAIPITPPATPVVAANTAGITTTFSWGSASCLGNTARYQYRYTISPSGYDSGIVATASTSVGFTTSTEGQTYTVATQAECYNAATGSGMSAAGSGSYFRPVT